MYLLTCFGDAAGAALAPFCGVTLGVAYKCIDVLRAQAWRTILNKDFQLTGLGDFLALGGAALMGV